MTSFDPFDEWINGPHEKLSFELPDADIVLFKSFWGSQESRDFYLKLVDETPWQQDDIQMYGKNLLVPRLSAWMANVGVGYSYSNIPMKIIPWVEPVVSIKNKIESETSKTFNSVLINYYRNGSDSVAWHSDDEPELGKNPVIASASFGAARYFLLKHKFVNHKEKILLEPGDLLMMKGSTQHFWQHQIAKSKKIMTGRINLTFRWINT